MKTLTSAHLQAPFNSNTQISQTPSPSPPDPPGTILLAIAPRRSALSALNTYRNALQNLQLTFLTILGLVYFVNGPQSRDGGTPNGSQVNVAQDQTQTAPDQTQTDQAQAQTAQPLTAADLTAADKSALRKSAVFAKKLQEPRASQV